MPTALRNNINIGLKLNTLDIINYSSQLMSLVMADSFHLIVFEEFSVENVVAWAYHATHPLLVAFKSIDERIMDA